VALPITLTTDGAGAATAFSGRISGFIIGYYVDIGTLAAGAVDITVTDDSTTEALLTLVNVAASVRLRPRLPTHDSTGQLTGALDAPWVDGRLKVVVAQGGATKTGTLYVYVDGSASSA
jgi:hypothetical protein